MIKKIFNNSIIETKILIRFFVIVISLLIFIYIANLVELGKTKNFDDWILLSLRNKQDVSKPIGPGWLEAAMINITSLGGTTVISIITIVVVGYLIFKKNYQFIFVVLIATIGGALIVLLMKNFFGRERPEIVTHLVYATSFSFPSGHSMMSAVVYLTQAALISEMQERRSIKIYILTFAIILTILIGISRVYLGVHYPTDVLAGWALGALWAYVCWIGSDYYMRRFSKNSTV